MTSTSVQVYDDRSKEFQYQGFWFNNGTWTASDGESGTLSSTNVPNANFTFTFPVAAVGFRFYGMQRSKGGLYGICVDCDPNKLVFKDVDAFNATDSGQSTPIVLFSQNFTTPSVRVVIVRNQPDSRGTPAGNSQLTLDRFELLIPSSAPNTVTVTSDPTSSLPTQTGSGGSNNVASSKSTPIGAIVGGVVGGIAVIAFLIILTLWLRRRKQATRSNTVATPLEAPEMRNAAPPTDPELATTTAATSSSGGRWMNGYGQAGLEKGGSRHHPQASFSSNPSSNGNTTAFTATSTGLVSPSSPPGPSSIGSPARSVNESSFASGSRRLREQDAGPAPRDFGYDQENDTLPPEYGQLFRDRRSARASQVPEQQAPQGPARPLPPPEKNR